MQSSISSDIAVSHVTASGNKIGYPLLQKDVDYSNDFVNSNSDISFLILVLNLYFKPSCFSIPTKS